MFSPDEEYSIRKFLQEVPTRSHDARQLIHVQEQIIRAQAGLNGEGTIQRYYFEANDLQLNCKYEISTTVKEQFVKGMRKAENSLRRNI